MKAEHMKADQFKIKAQKHIEQLFSMIDEMPYKGDLCSESQRVCLIIRLRSFEALVNGVTYTDFISDDDN